MIDDRFVREVFDEVVLIFDFKEYNEYKKFPFVDNFEESRRAQFYPKKVELTEVQNREFIKILINKYHSGMIKEIELPEWENKLRNAGLIPTEKSKTVESLSEIFESNEETTTILEREIIKKKASRFENIL